MRTETPSWSISNFFKVLFFFLWFLSFNPLPLVYDIFLKKASAFLKTFKTYFQLFHKWGKLFSKNLKYSLFYHQLTLKTITSQPKNKNPFLSLFKLLTNPIIIFHQLLLKRIPQ